MRLTLGNAPWTSFFLLEGRGNRPDSRRVRIQPAHPQFRVKATFTPSFPSGEAAWGNGTSQPNLLPSHNTTIDHPRKVPSTHSLLCHPHPPWLCDLIHGTEASAPAHGLPTSHSWSFPTQASHRNGGYSWAISDQRH